MKTATPKMIVRMISQLSHPMPADILPPKKLNATSPAGKNVYIRDFENGELIKDGRINICILRTMFDSQIVCVPVVDAEKYVFENPCCYSDIPLKTAARSGLSILMHRAQAE